MKRIVAAISAMAALCCAAEVAGEEDEYAMELERWSAGAGATLLLPQGGSRLRRAGGAEARVGWCLSEFWTAEVSAAWCEDMCAVSGGFLWLWWGYERLDPFFTFGLRDWIDRDCGPYGGAGAFWHIDDHWSLRFDASAMYALEHPGMAYSLSLGVQRSW